jgi:hypothetical protein
MAQPKGAIAVYYGNKNRNKNWLSSLEKINGGQFLIYIYIYIYTKSLSI